MRLARFSSSLAKRSRLASSFSFFNAVRSISEQLTALELVDLRRHRVEFHASREAASSMRSMALSGRNRSVMSVRKGWRGHQRGVLNSDAVVHLVALFQARGMATDASTRFVDGDRLEAPLQRGILLDVLAVLIGVVATTGGVRLGRAGA